MSGSSTFSVIGTDVVIAGNITAEVDLHVDGRVEGDIKCAALVQGKSSEVHGAIIAQSARLAGTVKGSIDAHDLVIEASAHVTGDIAYETLSIEQGGHVDGQFRHKSKIAQTVRPAQPASAPASNGTKPVQDGIPGFLKEGPNAPRKVDLTP